MIPTKEANGSSVKTLIIPGIIGNILEWYDFSLYGFFAPIIAHIFFPVSTKTLSLLATFGVFAIGFLMRPLGAIVFGYFGDRLGRKKILSLAIMLMAVPTACIGLLPSYDQIGIYAPLLLILCRLLQGMAIGGEFSGSIIYILEHANSRSRGLYGSWAMCGAFTGLLLGSAVGALTANLAGSELAHYAWRIPFLMGIVLGVIGLYLRVGMPETPNFSALLAKGRILKNPLLHALSQHPQVMLKVAGLVLLPSLSFYMLFVYLSSYLSEYLHLPLSESLMINTISLGLLVLVIPAIGYLSDRVGRKPVLLTGAMGMAILVYPLFLLLQQATFMAVLTAQMVFAVLVAWCFAAIPSTLVEMFDTDIRYSGMSLPYNLSQALFGGTAPLMATFLISSSGSIFAPSFYLIFAALIMAGFVLSLQETYGKPLR